MPYGYLVHPRSSQLRDVLGNRILDAPDIALLDGDAHKGGDKRFRHRERRLGRLAVVTVEIPLVQKPIIADHQEGGGAGVLKELLQRLGGLLTSCRAERGG